MKIYLVGGAVRDQLLKLPVKEKDWVVVGATPNDMLQNGFRQVGKDFPVFLHPETKEEYALARTERKIGRGYTGFEFDTTPTVTLEEDLKRRDVTINAMAETAEGEIIDPFAGQKDLKMGILRHVSPAFAEDPVRILRVGRFAARFGFSVAPETIVLMKEMVRQGEVDALVAERVWKELARALLEKHPEKFFAVLEVCGAAKILFPLSLDIVSLTLAANNDKSGEMRFAVLLHNLPETEVRTLCDRYRVPTSYRDLAILVSKYFSKYSAIKQFSAEEILDVLMGVDAFRREARFKDFLSACEIIIKGEALNALLQEEPGLKDIDLSDLLQVYKETIEKSPLQQIQEIWGNIPIDIFLLKCFEAAKAVTIDSINAKNGKEIGQKIKELRIAATKKLINK